MDHGSIVVAQTGAADEQRIELSTVTVSAELDRSRGVYVGFIEAF